MARAWRNNNLKGRRMVALENLKNSQFFEKVNTKGVARTQEKWQARKDAEIEILQKRV